MTTNKHNQESIEAQGATDSDGVGVGGFFTVPNDMMHILIQGQ